MSAPAGGPRPETGEGLDLRGIGIGHGTRQIIRDLSLHCRPGEILGLVGPNGCGKSTLLKSVYRALSPQAGTVLVDGRDLAGMRYRESADLVAALPQEERSDLDFTVAEIVAMGHRARPAGAGRGGPAETVPQVRGGRDVEIREAMARTDVESLAHRSILTLSGGERQRVLIARAFAQRTPYLVLDEPTNHLDLRHQIRLLRTLRAAAGAPDGEERSTTVLMALHDLNLAISSCDRVALLTDGRIHALGPPEEVLTEDAVEEVYRVRPTAVRHPDTGVRHLLFTV